MNNSLIGLMRDTQVFMRATAASVAITFGMMILSPAAIAAKNELTRLASAVENSSQETISSVYEKLADRLEKFEQLRDDDEASDEAIADIKEELDSLEDQLDDIAGDFESQFEETEKTLTTKKLPEKILNRHQDMVAHYNAHKQAIKNRLDDRNKGQFLWKVERLYDTIKQKITGKSDRDVESPIQVDNIYKFKRSQQAFDPNNMPNKSMRPDKDNKPKKFKHDYTQAGLFNAPTVQTAALGDFSYDKLTDASNPAYLAETDEVLLSQPIKDQAQALEYDPVKIYHWVRNNIEWQPTWGAVQDAELTLDARRGNAMDIASLTIALLRASQIPARYVHGTIEVPIERFNNWAGGFTSSDAAVDYAASGGIPTGAGTRGGIIIEARLEHIWVEAAIDYFPSRGARNWDADAWVSMDPSYKQYTFLEGLDAVAISGIDTDQLAQDFINSGTVNEAEGWVSGFDPTILEAAQASAQTALQDYIFTNIPNPTVGDVIGGRQTIIQEAPSLAAGLPNRVIVEGVRYDKLPQQLQQTVTYSLGKDELRQPLNPTTFAWSTLNNEKVTLSFRPATPEDEQALLSLLPEGEITDLSQLPSSIPSYLIEVIPEFKVNGELKISGNPMTLGQELVFNTTIMFPGRSKSENYDYNVIAGSYLSVNVVAGSVSPRKLAELQASLKSTKAKLESNDGVQLATITRQELLADIFYGGSLGYYQQFITSSNVMAQSSNSHIQLSSGYGSIGYEPNIDFLFGFPIGVSEGGVVLDIPINVVTANSDGNVDSKIDFLIQIGALSSTLEHVTPEQMFIDTANPIEAISAVKALQIAESEGQRAYQITQENVDTVMPLLNLTLGSKQEISASVAAGFEVITHTEQVSITGYTGEGYVIIDPETGSGAYKITSGANGGFAVVFSQLQRLYFASLATKEAAVAIGASPEFKDIIDKAIDYLLCMLSNFTELAGLGAELYAYVKFRDKVANMIFRSILTKAKRLLILKIATIGVAIALLSLMISCLPPLASIKPIRNRLNQYG